MHMDKKKIENTGKADLSRFYYNGNPEYFLMTRAEYTKIVGDAIDEFETFLMADYGQKDWGNRFFRSHFNILREQVGLDRKDGQV
jgi:hypothetical protein